jgi:hypothetical protein
MSKAIAATPRPMNSKMIDETFSTQAKLKANKAVP